jgi:hypothetical protein
VFRSRLVVAEASEIGLSGATVSLRPAPVIRGYAWIPRDPTFAQRRPCRLNIAARTLGAGMFKAYRVRLPGLIASLATLLMPVVLHSAVGSGATSGKISSILGTWTGTWTNANNVTTGTESFVVQTQDGSTITGFFCWEITQDPTTCSSNINDYESWTGTIDPTGTLVITGQLGDYPAKLSLDGTSISGTYQNRRIASHTGTWGVQKAPSR